MWKISIYDKEPWKKFLAPWKTLRLPGVWLVMFWYAGLVGGVVTITTVAPTLVSEPPYLWGNNAGLIMTGGIVGALLGLIATILTADRMIVSRETLRGEVFVEPEARLPVAVPGLILATAGLWTFGFCAQNPGPPYMWVGMQFGIGMLCFGLMQAPSIGFNYVSQRVALEFQSRHKC
jgi:ABC-type Fe3+ transport system permease subunit